MTRRTRRFPRLAIAIVAVGLAAPATGLGYVDHRSPDAIDSGIQAQKAEQMQNQLRKLEAQREAPGYVDHRSADAQGAPFVRTAKPTPSTEPVIVTAGDGFDWGDAGIGAGAALGLLLIGLSVMFTVTHHRNRAATV